MVIWRERGAIDLHMVELIPLSPHHFCISEVQNGLSFRYQLTQVVLGKMLSNVVIVVVAAAAAAAAMQLSGVVVK